MKDEHALNSDLTQRRLAATPRGATTLAGFFAARARNAELWDSAGRRYIDFAGGIGVLNTGHSHPRVVAAAQAQIEAFSHCCYAVAPYEGYVRLAERLNELAPIAGPAKTAFFTTGAEAVENAVKIARASTGRSGIIAFGGGFHGRTMLGMSLTGKVAPYKIGFGPFLPDVHHALFPSHGVTVADALASVERLFASSVEPARVAAMIVEPVQGEGGFNPAPAAFLAGLRAICDRHGILLIADEIQAGFGRTGRWFATEHSQIKPDLITAAKSLAGGYPLSAVIGRAEVMDAAIPGALGGTYAGNPVAIAAANAVIEVIEDEALLARAEKLGAQLVARLERIRETDPGLAEIRGLGSMIAAEFCQPGRGGDAFDPERAKRIQTLALERGLIVLICGPGASALRFLYPLTIQDQVFAEALDILESCCRDTAPATRSA